MTATAPTTPTPPHKSITSSFTGAVVKSLSQLSNSSPWAFVALMGLPLVCFTVVVVYALAQPQLSEAVAKRLTEPTKDVVDGLGRLDRTVVRLSDTIALQDARGNGHAAALDRLTEQLTELVTQVAKLTSRVARIEQGDTNGQEPDPGEEHDDG